MKTDTWIDVNHEWIKNNHDYVAEFVQNTENDVGTITIGMTAIIVQFLSQTRRKLQIIAKNSNGLITNEQLLETQIGVLRNCIIDLQEAMSFQERPLQ